MDRDIDQSWRAEMTGWIHSGDSDLATKGLLRLVLHDPDGPWVERVIKECMHGDFGYDVRLLAVTCVGHVARLRGGVTDESLVEDVRALRHDANLELAEEAGHVLEEVELYTSRHQPAHDGPHRSP
ncbi:hypothetical protein [Actinokineospora bangkokensis]|uniref:HEAT repeat domain-containing protein n=1 Tax=Actinokineospora bangkokensis TaxID=1193682 RepID=A0A1Q9LH28_9PSEU|nr:hypothetical protein [Actinokineospora bangkokensis]OLR91249.1 hypothetical protein BJP25_26625 [Actinokineospora bangkokensis]